MRSHFLILWFLVGLIVSYGRSSAVLHVVQHESYCAKFQLNSTWNASDTNVTVLVSASGDVLSDVGSARLQQGSVDVELSGSIGYSIFDNEGSFVLEAVNNGSMVDAWSVRIHPPVVGLRREHLATETLVAGIPTTVSASAVDRSGNISVFTCRRADIVVVSQNEQHANRSFGNVEMRSGVAVLEDLVVTVSGFYWLSVASYIPDTTGLIMAELSFPVVVPGNATGLLVEVPTAVVAGQRVQIAASVVDQWSNVVLLKPGYRSIGFLSPRTSAFSCDQYSSGPLFSAYGGMHLLFCANKTSPLGLNSSKLAIVGTSICYGGRDGNISVNVSVGSFTVSHTILVVPGPAATLRLLESTAIPSQTLAGNRLPWFSVHVVDLFGNDVVAASGVANITDADLHNCEGMSSQLSMPVIRGVANFSELVPKCVGNYSLSVTVALPHSQVLRTDSVSGAGFVVIPGAALYLWSDGDVYGSVGEEVVPQPGFTVKDLYGNVAFGQADCVAQIVIGPVHFRQSCARVDHVVFKHVLLLIPYNGTGVVSIVGSGVSTSVSVQILDQPTHLMVLRVPSEVVVGEFMTPAPTVQLKGDSGVAIHSRLHVSMVCVPDVCRPALGVAEDGVAVFKNVSVVQKSNDTFLLTFSSRLPSNITSNASGGRMFVESDRIATVVAHSLITNISSSGISSEAGDVLPPVEVTVLDGDGRRLNSSHGMMMVFVEPQSFLNVPRRCKIIFGVCTLSGLVGCEPGQFYFNVSYGVTPLIATFSVTIHGKSSCLSLESASDQMELTPNQPLQWSVAAVRVGGAIAGVAANLACEVQSGNKVVPLHCGGDMFSGQVLLSGVVPSFITGSAIINVSINASDIIWRRFLKSYASFSVKVIPGSTDGIVVSPTPPATLVAGDEFRILVSAVDVANQTVFSATEIAVSASLYVGGELLPRTKCPQNGCEVLVCSRTCSTDGTSSQTQLMSKLISGVAVFDSLSVLNAGDDLSIIFRYPGLLLRKWGPFTVIPAKARGLHCLNTDENTPAVGHRWLPGPVVNMVDMYGNKAAHDTFSMCNVVLSVVDVRSIDDVNDQSHVGGVFGIIGQTSAYLGAEGTVSFSNVVFNHSGNWSLVFRLVQAGNELSICSHIRPFGFVLNVDQAVTQLHLVHNETYIALGGGTAVQPPILVRGTDHFGKVVGDNVYLKLSVRIRSAPVGGRLGGSQTATFHSGLAAFSALKLSKLGIYTLEFVYRNEVAPAVILPVMVECVKGPAVNITISGFTQQVYTAGSATGATIQLVDANGNSAHASGSCSNVSLQQFSSDSNEVVYVDITSGIASVAIHTPVTASVSWYLTAVCGMLHSRVGPLSVVAGAPSNVMVSSAGRVVVGVRFPQSVNALAVDAFNNSVNLDHIMYAVGYCHFAPNECSDPGRLSSNYSAVIGARTVLRDTVIPMVGTFLLKVVAVFRPSGNLIVSRGNVVVVQGAPHRLVLTVHASKAVAMEVLVPFSQLRVLDDAGNFVSAVRGNVSASVVAEVGTSLVGNVKAVFDSDGVATFNFLAVRTSVSGCRIRYSFDQLTIDSDQFSVYPQLDRIELIPSFNGSSVLAGQYFGLNVTARPSSDAGLFYNRSFEVLASRKDIFEDKKIWSQQTVLSSESFLGPFSIRQAGQYSVTVMAKGRFGESSIFTPTLNISVLSGLAARVYVRGDLVYGVAGTRLPSVFGVGVVDEFDNPVLPTRGWRYNVSVFAEVMASTVVYSDFFPENEWQINVTDVVIKRASHAMRLLFLVGAVQLRDQNSPPLHGFPLRGYSSFFEIKSSKPVFIQMFPRSLVDIVAGSSLPRIVASLEDAYGNLAASFNGIVLARLLRVGEPQAWGTGSVNSVEVSRGQANFSELKTNLAQTGLSVHLIVCSSDSSGCDSALTVTSESFNVHPGPAVRIIIVSAPLFAVAGEPLLQDIRISFVDMYDNLVPGVWDVVTRLERESTSSLVIFNDSVTSEDGSALLRNAAVPVAAAIGRFRLSVVGTAGPFTLSSSGTIVIEPGVSDLRVLIPPTSVVSGEQFVNPPAIELLNSNGQRVLGSGAVVSVTLSRGNGVLWPQNDEKTYAVSVDGVVVFYNLSVLVSTAAGACTSCSKVDPRISCGWCNFVLSFSSSGHRVDSVPFDVSTPPSAVRFISNTKDCTADDMLEEQPSLHVLRHPSSEIRMDLSRSYFEISVVHHQEGVAGTLTGARIAQSVEGNVAWSKVSVRSAGVWRIVARIVPSAACIELLHSITDRMGNRSLICAGDVNGRSNPFVVTSGVLSRMSLNSSVAFVVAGSIFYPPPIVTALDTWGNPVHRAGVVTCSLLSGDSRKVKTFDGVAVNNNGYATFSSLIYTVAGTYTLHTKLGIFEAMPDHQLVVEPSSAKTLVYDGLLKEVYNAGEAFGNISVTGLDAYDNKAPWNDVVNASLVFGSRVLSFFNHSPAVHATGVSSGGLFIWSSIAVNVAADSVKLSFSGLNVLPVLTTAFSVNPSFPFKLMFLNEKAVFGVAAGEMLRSPPLLGLADRYGNFAGAKALSGSSVVAEVAYGDTGSHLKGKTAAALLDNSTCLFSSLVVEGNVGSSIQFMFSWIHDTSNISVLSQAEYIRPPTPRPVSTTMHGSCSSMQIAFDSVLILPNGSPNGGCGSVFGARVLHHFGVSPSCLWRTKPGTYTVLVVFLGANFSISEGARFELNTTAIRSKHPLVGEGTGDILSFPADIEDSPPLVVSAPVPLPVISGPSSVGSDQPLRLHGLESQGSCGGHFKQIQWSLRRYIAHSSTGLSTAHAHAVRGSVDSYIRGRASSRSLQLHIAVWEFDLPNGLLSRSLPYGEYIIELTVSNRWGKSGSSTRSLRVMESVSLGVSFRSSASLAGFDITQKQHFSSDVVPVVVPEGMTSSLWYKWEVVSKGSVVLRSCTQDLFLSSYTLYPGAEHLVTLTVTQRWNCSTGAAVAQCGSFTPACAGGPSPQTYAVSYETANPAFLVAFSSGSVLRFSEQQLTQINIDVRNVSISRVGIPVVKGVETRWQCLLQSKGGSGGGWSSCNSLLIARDSFSVTINGTSLRASDNLQVSAAVADLVHNRNPSTKSNLFTVGAPGEAGPSYRLSVRSWNADKIPVSKDLVLVMHGEPSAVVQYSWGQYGDKGAGKLDFNRCALNGIHFPFVKLRSACLVPGSLLTFQLRGVDPVGVVGFGLLQLEVNMAPANGHITVLPTLGSALSTEFVVITSGWEDDDLPLLFSYALNRLHFTPLPLGGGGQSSPMLDKTLLPVALAGSNVSVAVFDSLGDKSVASARVEVLRGGATSVGVAASVATDALTALQQGYSPSFVWGRLSVAAASVGDISECSGYNASAECSSTLNSVASAVAVAIGSSMSGNQTFRFPKGQRTAALHSLESISGGLGAVSGSNIEQLVGATEILLKHALRGKDVEFVGSFVTVSASVFGPIRERELTVAGNSRRVLSAAASDRLFDVVTDIGLLSAASILVGEPAVDFQSSLYECSVMTLNVGSSTAHLSLPSGFSVRLDGVASSRGGNVNDAVLMSCTWLQNTSELSSSIGAASSTRLMSLNGDQVLQTKEWFVDGHVSLPFATNVTRLKKGELCSAEGGQSCVFPFVYRNAIFRSCTSHYRNVSWCAVASGAGSPSVSEEWAACLNCSGEVDSGRFMQEGCRRKSWGSGQSTHVYSLGVDYGVSGGNISCSSRSDVDGFFYPYGIEVGCDGRDGSNAVYDACGVCNGGDRSCSGCDGVPHSGRSRSCSGHGWCVDSCRDYIEAGRTCVAYIAVAGIVANGPGCACDEGWYDDVCSTRCDRDIHCSSHGSCTRPGGNCFCADGWEGSACNVSTSAEALQLKREPVAFLSEDEFSAFKTYGVPTLSALGAIILVCVGMYVVRRRRNRLARLVLQHAVQRPKDVETGTVPNGNDVLSNELWVAPHYMPPIEFTTETDVVEPTTVESTVADGAAEPNSSPRSWMSGFLDIFKTPNESVP